MKFIIYIIFKSLVNPLRINEWMRYFSCLLFPLYRVNTAVYPVPAILQKRYSLQRLLYFIRAVGYSTPAGCSIRIRSGIRVVKPKQPPHKMAINQSCDIELAAPVSKHALSRFGK